MNEKIEQLKVKIFADGADKAGLLALSDQSYIKGFTTNPSLMRQDGVRDFQGFARDISVAIQNKPISFGVLADEFADMERQARTIAAWGENVYVKIPITNTRGESSYTLIKKLSAQGIKLNITAVMTLEQIKMTLMALSPAVPSFISVFAGRIADTGDDPMPLMRQALDLCKSNPAVEIIWASARELFNLFQADSIGCHVITLTQAILKKLPLVGYNLEDYSLETVRMFYQDAKLAGFTVPV